MRNGMQYILIGVIGLAACSDDAEPAPQFGNSGQGTGDVGDTGGEGGEGEGDGAGGNAMPNNAYCQPVEVWDSYWIAHAEEVVELINEARSTGGNCGLQTFPPAPALAWDPALTCASRVHSGDMAERDYVDHTNPEGKDAAWRLQQAGFSGQAWSEALGAGYELPSEVVQGWLDSELHCPNVRNGDFVAIGVGYAFNPQSKYKSYWTMSLGEL